MNDRARRAGYLAFFISDICAISASVIISLLQESRGLDYGMSGMLLSLMSIGNLAAGFLTGILPGKLGAKPTVLLLTAGYAVGYALMLPRGGALWLLFAALPLGSAGGQAKTAVDWSFLRSGYFWLLTALLFC